MCQLYSANKSEPPYFLSVISPQSTNIWVSTLPENSFNHQNVFHSSYHTINKSHKSKTKINKRYLHLRLISWYFHRCNFGPSNMSWHYLDLTKYCWLLDHNAPWIITVSMNYTLDRANSLKRNTGRRVSENAELEFNCRRRSNLKLNDP